MNDPFGLEPPHGDYVAYLQALQAGRIRNLDPLQIAGSQGSPSPAAPQRHRSALEELARISLPGGAPETGPAPGGPAVPESPQEKMRRRARNAGRSQAMAAFSGLTAFIGFTLFAIGGALDREELVLLGMAVTFLGFLGAVKSKG